MSLLYAICRCITDERVYTMVQPCTGTVQIAAAVFYTATAGVTTEQAAAEYDTNERRARLDLWYADPYKGHTWVDVTVCAAAAHDGVSVH